MKQWFQTSQKAFKTRIIILYDWLRVPVDILGVAYGVTTNNINGYLLYWNRTYIIFFKKDFIHSLMEDTQREAETQAEGEAGSLRGSQDPGIMPWAQGRRSTAEPPRSPSAPFLYIHPLPINISPRISSLPWACLALPCQLHSYSIHTLNNSLFPFNSFPASVLPHLILAILPSFFAHIWTLSPWLLHLSPVSSIDPCIVYF